MTASHFEAHVRHEQGVAVIDVRGDVDAFAEETLNAAYAEAVGGDSTAVLLNFDSVGYINSAGIGLIVVLLAETLKSSRRLLACGLSDHYREIFEITRLADLMGIFPDETSAITNASAAAAADR